MTRHGFPFPALVGLDTLKMALQLAAIDHRLSVLIRGDKGAGKSTAARGLVDLLSTGAPFVTLPIGATEDRLLGGLDVERALKGEPALKRGLLAEAHDGVLYIDEVNLLPDHLADPLLDAVASGQHVVEREGFSAVQAAEFVLVGSMNPEEGTLRPQLLDRFAFAVDVRAPLDPETRSEVIQRRLAFDADGAAFAEVWRPSAERMARELDAARHRVRSVVVSPEMVRVIAERVSALAVRSLRADLAVVRGARALAALRADSAVDVGHVEAVLPLALAHRTHNRPDAPPPSLPPPPNPPDARGDERQGQCASAERVFAPVEVAAPRLVVDHRAAGGDGSASAGSGRGAALGARRTDAPAEVDLRASVLHAVQRTGTAKIQAEDLHERVREPRAGTRYVFVVDSSGSHAVGDRMRLLKGAVIGLLASAHDRRDEVAVIVCRGPQAAVLAEPTSSPADAERALAYVPTGGRTPLAHALEVAAGYTTDRSVLVLLTDGHANVPTRTSDAWADALTAAGAIRCPALVIDSEDDQQQTGRPAALAEAMKAIRVRLADLDQISVLDIIRTTA